MADPQAPGAGDAAAAAAAGKAENGDSWDVPPSGPTKGGAPPALAETPPSSGASEPQGGVALKVATTVLQPICLGDRPLMLPIHLQMAGAAGSQLGQIGASQCFLTSQGPVSLPLVLDQQLLQHLGSAGLPQSAGCPVLPLQNNMLCQNASLSFGMPPGAVEQKPSGHFQDANVLALLQNPAFAALLQDLFSPQTPSSSSCQPPGAAPADSFFAPSPPGPHPYGSPLAPLVPPATLLVPYPVVIPLPVPLPVPLPIPVPVPRPEDSKVDVPKAVCTVSRSTQTMRDASSPPLSEPGPPSLNASPSTPPPDEGEALDLSVRTCPLKPKQEYPCLQDDVLDLSVPSVRKRCAQSSGRPAPREGERVFTLRAPQDSSALSLGVLRPVECSQSVDSKLLSGLASLEFSRKHKWLVDSGAGGAGPLGRDASLGGAGKLELVSTSQTAKVIVSVKDAIPAILCGKIKGLSGVSTKNFSIKRDGTQGSTLQQLCGAASRAQGEQQDSGSPHRKLPKSRAIKLKKVSSQEIHIVPIKKQRLAAFLPRK